MTQTGVACPLAARPKAGLVGILIAPKPSWRAAVPSSGRGQGRGEEKLAAASKPWLWFWLPAPFLGAGVALSCDNSTGTHLAAP